MVALVERHLAALGAEVIGFAEWHEGLALAPHLEQVGAAEEANLAGYDTEVGITTEPAAVAYDLDFVSLAAERSHLVLSRPLLTTPEAQALLRALGSPHMRAQLGGLPGYGGRPCGEAVCSL